MPSHLDCLTIPAMSASAERLFSSTNLTVSDLRCRLGDDVIRAIECLKSWTQSELVDYELLGNLNSILESLHRENEYVERYGRE